MHGEAAPLSILPQQIHGSSTDTTLATQSAAALQSVSASQSNKQVRSSDRLNQNSPMVQREDITVHDTAKGTPGNTSHSLNNQRKDSIVTIPIVPIVSRHERWELVSKVLSVSSSETNALELRYGNMDLQKLSDNHTGKIEKGRGMEEIKK